MYDPIPCFSANGKIGTRKIIKRFPPLKRIDVYDYVVPSNPRTPAQQANRQRFADAMAAWKLLSAEEQAVYEWRTHDRPLCGKNIFVREYLKANPLNGFLKDESGEILKDEFGERWKA